MRALLTAALVTICALGATAPWTTTGTWSRAARDGRTPGRARASASARSLRGRGAPGAAGAAADGTHPLLHGRDLVHTLDVVVLLDLLDAAMTSGAGLPRALGAVGRATGGEEGEALVRASSALVMGADWRAAWAGVPSRLAPLVDGLGATWVSGAAPGPALRAAADRLRRERRAAAREAAGRLGVHLVLPLGLCFLPAFVLIGLVPVLVSLSGDLIR
ncbi:type II secretion system F family protein [Cellulomonas fimi]|uniref:Secretion system protein n=1 Tax=Cellulomonas fimi TaxID=1708 RepID=A0A7Y0LXB0_CELFI|nr:type II secretion system F family protein [Cellulomonas fimi]NMR19780.1 secretion system protein [Cellulomonas fimi]